MRFPVTPHHMYALVTGVPYAACMMPAPHGARAVRPHCVPAGVWRT